MSEGQAGGEQTVGQPTGVPDRHLALETFGVGPSTLEAARVRPGADLVVGGELRKRRVGVGWGVARVLLHLSLLFLPWFVLRQAGRFLLGWRRHATLRLVPDGLVVRQQVSFLGRRVRDAELYVPLDAVQGIGLVQRYRWLHFLVGLLCLVLGGSVGIVAIHDGISGGYAPLALAGFGLLGLGVLLDLALHVLVPAARKRSQVELRMPHEQIWIGGVDDDLAEDFVRAVIEAVRRR